MREYEFERVRVYEFERVRVYEFERVRVRVHLPVNTQYICGAVRLHYAGTRAQPAGLSGAAGEAAAADDVHQT